MTTARPFSMGRLFVGVLLVALGALWMLEEFTDVDVAWSSVLSVMLILVGLTLMIGATTGSHRGLITFGVVLAVLVALSSALEVVADVPFRGGIGDHEETPFTLESEYRWAIGSMRIDLTEASSFEDTVEMSVGIGELVITVPAGLSVAVDAEVGIGEVVVFGRSESGLSPEVDFGDQSADLRIIARVGIGKIEVRRG